MKKIILITLPLLILLSCSPIMKILYGIKNPDIENEHSIIKKALKLGLDTNNIVTVCSKEFPYVLKGQSIPDCTIFDSDGNYIEYRQTDTSCNAGLFEFIPKLNLNNQYNKANKTNLEKELEKFRNLKGGKIQDVKQADFYLFIYWTVWIGKLNKDHVKVWEDLAKENKNCSIKVIKVNLDIQEYWDETERNKIIKAMTNK